MTERASHDTSAFKDLSDKDGFLPFYWRTVIRPNAKSAFLLAVLMLGSALLQMGTIGLAVPLLEISSGRGSRSWVVNFFRATLSRIGATPDEPSLIFGVLLFAGMLFVGYSGLMFLHQYVANTVGEKLRRRTKVRILERFLLGRFETIAGRGRGSILQDLSSPPAALYGSIIRLTALLSGVVNSLVLVAFMMYLSVWATLLVATLSLVGLYSTHRIVDSRARKVGRVLYELEGEESRTTTDAIEGLRVVKAYGLEHTFITKLSALLDAGIRPALQVARYRYMPTFLNELAAVAVVAILGAFSVFMPGTGLSFPALAAFLLAIRQCGSSVANINGLMAELQSMRKGVEVVWEVLEELPREPSGSLKRFTTNEICFDDVSLGYESRDIVLHGVDLTMRRGTVTAIVGSTGAGKSSIASLVVALYRPSSGRILVDGVDLNDLDLAEWRKRIGYVCQDTFLFNASIRENIALWSSSFSEEEIGNAARLAQLHDFVAGLPEGYNTVVGDRGLRLSGGQCQRVAIARAILTKPAVLVLDEATSALDNLTEKAVYEAMHALRASSIVMAVAHRLSTIKDADQIVVVDGGRVTQIGTHSSLMIEGGSYFRLYETESVQD